MRTLSASPAYAGVLAEMSSPSRRRFYVDDQLVVNADGLHNTVDAVMGTVHLTKGTHQMRVRYFQGPGDGALMLGWKKAGTPTSETKPIPRRLFGRPSGAALAE